MSRARIDLDFAHRPRRLNGIGTALLAAGLIATALVVVDYRSVAAESQGIGLRLDALRPAGLDFFASGKSASKSSDDVHAAVTELATPWSVLLRELEHASADNADSVALLAIEPDREHRSVRITAESRNLSQALGYVERLQKSAALRFPMLASHEVQSKDPEHPVRVVIKAEWKLDP
jgi:hypothetical protein